MKVFISWSGTRSRKVAELLNEWIQCVLQSVVPWLSSKDIDKGSLWFSEIANQLADTNNGIVCLTKSNVSEAWILFESGALAKGLTSNRVFTFLIDLQPTDIQDPLAQFNHTLPNKESVFQLITTINNGLDSLALKEKTLFNVFETYWPQFELGFNLILDQKENERITITRPPEDLLTEVLNSVRAIDKRLRKMEDFESSRHISELDSTISLDTPLEKFNLSVRAFNVLKGCDLITVADIMEVDLDQLRNMGVRSKKEISDLRDYIKRLRSNGSRIWVGD